MFNIKNALSFVATTLVESVSLTAELGVAVVVTCKDVATAGVQEGVAAAKETYAEDTAVEVVVAEEAPVVAPVAPSFSTAYTEYHNEVAFMSALVDAVEAEEAVATAEAARKVVADAVAPVVAPVAVEEDEAVGLVTRIKAFFHAVYVGVRTGVAVMVDDAPLVWATRHSTAMNRHHARVDARKAAHTAAPVPVAVVNEEAAAYSTAVPVEVVDVNDLTAEARVATAFAIFGVVLVRMISTVVRMAWTVIKVAVRIATFPVRKMFTITRRTRTAA